MTISEALIADFHLETGNTRKVLRAVPEKHFAWKPHEKSMALGRLAGHIAEIPDWVPSMLEDEMDFDAVLQDWKPWVPESSTALLAKFEEAAATMEPLLAGKTDAFMKATWTARAGGAVVMQMPRYEVIRTTAIHHLIHHRGQLTVFLRLLDVPVPGTYGPTADEQPPA